MLSDQDSTTADESDLEVNVRKPRDFTRRGAPIEPPARSLDAFQTAHKNGTVSPISQPTTASTRALGETEAQVGSRNMSQPKPTEAVHKPKGILGKIGGRVKREKGSELKDPPASVNANIPEDTTIISYVSPESRKFTQPPLATVNSRALLQPQSSPPPPPTPPRETSQERANNKREELKRQLESRINANVKKKRKF